MTLILVLVILGQLGPITGLPFAKETSPWHREGNTGILFRESSILLQEKESGPVEARLGFRATKILAVAAANGSHVFEPSEYQVSKDQRGLIFAKSAYVPVISGKDLFPAPGSPNSYKHRVGHPEQNMLYGPGRWFHDRQVEVTYETDEPWIGTKLGLPKDSLPKTMAKLKTKKELRIGISGDSISTGLDASALVKAPPMQKGYPDLIAADLEKAFGTKVVLINRAVSGTSITFGLADWPKLLESKPDLVIVAYGMNDVGRRDPKWFGDRVREFVARIKKDLPEAEIILVSSMLGNKEWIHTPAEMFGAYRDQLLALRGPGVAIADVTSVWAHLLTHKHSHDLTGNGLNHPNDFGHRLYAWAVLAQFPLQNKETSP